MGPLFLQLFVAPSGRVADWVRYLAHGASSESAMLHRLRACGLFVGLSDDRRFFVLVLIFLVFLFLVTIVVGISRRHGVGADAGRASSSNNRCHLRSKSRCRSSGYCNEVGTLLSRAQQSPNAPLAEQARNRDHHSGNPPSQAYKQQKVAQEKRHTRLTATTSPMQGDVNTSKYSL